MKLACPHCKHQLEIDDARLPDGTQFKVKCPKCSEPITGKGPSKQPVIADAVMAALVALPPEVKKDSLLAATEWERLKPFVEEYVSERIAPLVKELESYRSQSSKGDVPQAHTQQQDGNKLALVCEQNPKIEQAVSSSLSKMGYSLDKVKSVKDALKKMDGTTYELVATGASFVDDPSGAAAILARINARKFEERRRTFVVLVSTDLQTSGPENAFVHGANLTVNIRDLGDLEGLIRQGQLDLQKLSF